MSNSTNTTAFRFQMLLMPLANITIRSLSLLSRFALLVYLSRYFSLEEIGTYGLITAVVLITVALSDLGFGSYVGRELSGAETRTQLSLLFANASTLLITTPLIIVVIVFLQKSSLLSIDNSIIFYLILIFEIACNMFYSALVAVQRPLTSNIVVFVRSSLWVFPVIIIGLLYPSTRSLRIVLIAWLTGSLFALLCSVSFFSHLRVHIKTALIGALPKIKDGFSVSLPLWFAAASGISAQYADRFVIERLLGLDYVGIVTIFWTIANVVQILTSTCITFVFQPKLIISHNNLDKPAFRAQLGRTLLEAGIFSGGLSILLVAVFPYIAAGIGHGAILNYTYLFPFVMLASFLRIFSDCFYVALYAIRYDKGLWAPNVLALVISVTLNIVLIPIAGFLAVVLVSNLVALAGVMLRAFLLVLRLKETW